MFALNFVEEFARQTGRKHIYIHTISDNNAAQLLYKKSGYAVVEEAEHQCEYGCKLIRYTLYKAIIAD